MRSVVFPCPLRNSLTPSNALKIFYARAWYRKRAMLRPDSNLLVSVAAAKRASHASGRVDGIDVLRGLSILAVLVLHINLRIRIAKTFGQHWPAFVVSDIGWNGRYGVIVFFAISGFLITTMCLTRWNCLENISLRQFYRLRFARIAPMLLALLAVLSVLHLSGVPYFTIRPQVSTLPRALFAALTFHVNWLEAQHGYLPGNWDVLWSLSNEELFYLTFPLLCLLTRRRAALIGALSIFVVLGPFARTVLSQNPMWQENGYLSCMDAIAIGCIAAILSGAIRLPSGIRSTLLWTGTALAVFVAMCKQFVSQMGIDRAGLDVTLLSLGVALMCICFTQGNKPGRMEWAWLRWFGRNSYEVYLTHMMVIFPALAVLRRVDPHSHLAPLSYVAMIFLSGAFGSLIARCFSEPLNRYFRRTRAASQPTPAPIKVPAMND